MRICVGEPIVHWTRRLGLLLLGICFVGIPQANSQPPVGQQLPVSPQLDTTLVDDIGIRGQVSNDGFVPSVTLLPATTEGFVEFTNLPALADRWRQTSLSGIQKDPAMQPFLDSERAKIEQRLTNLGLQIGIKVRDLCDAVSGEVVLAWMSVDSPQTPFAVALLADTRGRDKERASMIVQIDAELRKRGASVTSKSMQGSTAAIYTLPRKKGQLGIERFGIVIVDGRIMISDRLETLEGFVSATKQGQPNNVTSQIEFKQVFSEIVSTHKVGEVVPAAQAAVRWYARPIQMGMIIRKLANIDRGKQVDILKLLQEQGFSAIKAVGGEFSFATEHYDLLHRGFVLAPPTSDTGERYQLAARALQFPNGSFGNLPGWVVPTAASLFRANWKMQDAFWASESLIDKAFSDQGFFRDLLSSIREDDGGGIEIDIEKDIIANLGEEVLVMTDNEVIGDVTHEKVLGAIRVANVAAVAQVIDEQLKKDINIFKVPFEGHNIWEVRQAEETERKVFDDVEIDFAFNDDQLGGNANGGNGNPLMEKWAFTVFDGYLMFSSHADLLEKVIRHSQTQGPTLASETDFQRIMEAVAREEGGQERAMERIVRTELTWRVKYQLIRAGKFLQSDSMLAIIISAIKESSEKAAPKKIDPNLVIDTSLLPPFENVRKFLQPGGGFMKTTDVGWSFTQFLLRLPE